MLIPTSLLQRINVAAPDLWAGPLSAAAAAQGITTPARIAPFLANIICETSGMRALSESLNYTPAALLRQWPSHFTPLQAHHVGRTAQHPANEIAIAEMAYSGRYGNGPIGSGDGWRFRGHGAMQTTFRSNYTALAHAIGWQDALEALPVWLQTVPGACTSAALYWGSHGCNALADAGDIAGIRRRINGGTIGLSVVATLTRNIRLAMHVPISVPSPTLVHPPVLVQPSGPRHIPMLPAEVIERAETERLNEQSYTDALNQRPHPS